MLLPYLSIGRRICEEQRKLGVSQGASDDMLSISSGAARPLLVMSGCENELDSLSLCGKIVFSVSSRCDERFISFASSGTGFRARSRRETLISLSSFNLHGRKRISLNELRFFN